MIPYSSFKFLAEPTIMIAVHFATWNAQNSQSERNFNSMRFTSNVAKSSAVILQIHVPSPLPTQYNVERSKELCFDGFNTLRGVGREGRDVYS